MHRSRDPFASIVTEARRSIAVEGQRDDAEVLSFVIDMPETYASLGPPGAQGFRGALCTAVHNRLCTSVVLDHLARGPGESGGSPEPELSAATWAA